MKIVSQEAVDQSLGFPARRTAPKRFWNLSIRPSVSQQLRIADISIRQTDFESAPMTVTVSLDAVGFDSETVNVQLMDLAGDEVVEEQTAKMAGCRASFDLAPDFGRPSCWCLSCWGLSCG